MIEYVVGAFLLVIGLAGTLNALGWVDRAGRLWPRPYTRGDAQNFITSAFLIRFLSLLLMLAGVALIALQISR